MVTAHAPVPPSYLRASRALWLPPRSVNHVGSCIRSSASGHGRGGLIVGPFGYDDANPPEPVDPAT